MLAWVRNIESFRFTFIFINFVLLLSVVVVSIMSIGKIANHGVKPDVEPIGKASLSFIGYAIYTYEGIGILMPCMQACACPEKFDQIVIAAVATLTVMYITYGTLAYLAFGAL